MRTYIPVGPRVLSCQGCGKEFAVSRSDAKWCEDCRWAKTHAHNSRPRPERTAPPVQHRECIRCQKTFQQKRNRKSGLCWECRAPSEYNRCPDCDAIKMAASKRCKRCHAKLLPKLGGLRGADNSRWRGGRVHRHGYVRILQDNGKYKGEHVLVWEKAHGPVPPKWDVHHLNGIKDDNRLENLLAMSRSEHHRNQHEPWEARIRELEAQ